MDEQPASNIILKSNIMPISGESPFADPAFIKFIASPAALARLKRAIESPGSGLLLPRGLALSRAQENILALSKCAYARGTVSGVVKRKGRYFRVTRCHRLAGCKWAATHGCLEERPIED